MCTLPTPVPRTPSEAQRSVDVAKLPPSSGNRSIASVRMQVNGNLSPSRGTSRAPDSTVNHMIMFSVLWLLVVLSAEG